MPPRTTTSGADAARVTKATLKGRWSATGTRYLGVWDTRLYLPTVAELRELGGEVHLLFDSLVSQNHAEAFDCEDYSFAFAGMIRTFAAKRLSIRFSIAVGVAMGRFSWTADERHVCNWCLVRPDEDGVDPVFSWLEPQSNPAADPHWFRGADTASQLEMLII